MVEIGDRVIEIVNGLSVVGTISGTEDKLIELGIDSLKKVELMIGLEDEFAIQFDDSDLNPANFSTIQDLINLLKKYIGDE